MRLIKIYNTWINPSKITSITVASISYIKNGWKIYINHTNGYITVSTVYESETLAIASMDEVVQKINKELVNE